MLRTKTLFEIYIIKNKLFYQKNAGIFLNEGFSNILAIFDKTLTALSLPLLFR